ncbi:MAG TPA: hypothetical protein VGH28_15620 [Polyangiaceae bacterium]|jgi:hypothetical protein
MKATAIAFLILACACHQRENTAPVSVTSDTPTSAPSGSATPNASATQVGAVPATTDFEVGKLLSASDEAQLTAEEPTDGGLGLE